VPFATGVDDGRGKVDVQKEHFETATKQQARITYQTNYSQ